MTSTDIINEVADYVLLAALIPNLVFAYRYFLFSPYQLTAEGRNMLHKKLALSSLIVVVLLSLFLGAEYPGREWLRLASFGAVTLFYAIETGQLIRLQEKYPYNRWPWLARFRSKK